MIKRTEDRRTVEDVISRIAQSRKQRNHQLSAVLNRIDEMSTQLKSLHENVAAQMVSFFLSIIYPKLMSSLCKDALFFLIYRQLLKRKRFTDLK